MVYITLCLVLYLQTFGSVFLCPFMSSPERTVNMSILKNKTHGNFTMISNTILKDKKLSMKDRGVLCTLCSLPDGWDFSINGLSAIVPDGTSSIRASIENLEELGYLVRTKTRNSKGHFTSMIEIFTEKRVVSIDSGHDTRERKPATDNPPRKNNGGKSVMENRSQYNTDNIKSKYDNNMLYQSTIRSRSQFHNFPQRDDYDFEALEKKLIKN